MDLRRRRTEIAEQLRAFLAPHQRALATSTARVLVTDKNRRSGATETLGREALARCVERDGYVVIAVAENRAAFSRNYWLRKGGAGEGDGGVDLLKQSGFREAKGARWRGGLEARITRDNRGDVSSIEWPWGSAIYVFGADSERDIQALRGFRFDLLWGDECQNLVHLLVLLKEIAVAAGSERKAQIAMSGTPSSAVDTYFAQACQRMLEGIDVHAVRSWDNPVYGATWEERYRAGVIEPLQAAISMYNVSEAHLEALARLSRDEAVALGQVPLEDLPGDVNAPGYELEGGPNMRKLAHEVDPAALREFFARWVGAAEVYVYAARFVAQDLLYYASHELELEQRLSALPQAPHVGTSTRPKRWRAVVCSDLGSGGDSSRGGVVALLHSREDPAVYEIESTWLAVGAGEDEQFEGAARLCVELDKLDIALDVLIYDPGGQGHAIGKSWAPRLRARLMAYGFKGQIPAVVPARKDGRKSDDIRLLNADMRRGHLRGLSGSPLDIEQRALQWRLRSRSGKQALGTDQNKPEDVDREVPGPDGRLIRPGNDCCDARLYAWRHCVYVLRGAAAEATPQPGSDAAIDAENQRIRARRLKASGKARRR